MAGLILVVLDPLQPLCALDLIVPENAQFVCSRLAALAASTGASVIVSHHFAKREASTPEQAREAIRGTGGVVKANGRANLKVATFLRDTRGLLVDRSRELVRASQPDADFHPALKTAIARAAVEGRPYTKTGGNGVYERRHELPEAFHAIGKHPLAEWVGALLDREELVMAMAEGSKLVKWLDVPDGPVARGEAVFITGHLSRSQPGMKDSA